jgi:nucleoid-associated protein YejK
MIQMADIKDSLQERQILEIMQTVSLDFGKCHLVIRNTITDFQVFYFI